MSIPKPTMSMFNSREEYYQAKAEYLEFRVRQLEQAMEEFVQRVEDGEIRSSRTYSMFKRLLAA